MDIGLNYLSLALEQRRILHNIKCTVDKTIYGIKYCVT